MSAKTRGADHVVRTLYAAGVRQLFTVSGNHVMSLFDAALDARLALLHARHEAAAVHMADAYARVANEVGVALVTAGPGHANALSALYTAQLAESPVVLLSGHAPMAELGLGSFQEMPQVAMAASVTKAAWRCERSDDVAADVVRALRIARSGRPGSVHLSLPSDVLDGVGLSASVAEADFRVEPVALDPKSGEDILSALQRAERPLILIGPACLTRTGRALGACLAAATGIPVIGMESPRGIADPSLGAFAEMLAQADLVLLLGKRLDFSLRFGRAPALAVDCHFLQIDAEEDEFRRTQRSVGERLLATASADAFSALRSLADACRAVDAGVHAEWTSEVQAAIAYRPANWDTARPQMPDRLHPVQALRPLQPLLDSHPDAVLIADGGEFGQWAQACLSAPHRVVNGVAGSIGSSLPCALGARVASPAAPVVALMGDGTFGFHPAEIDTALRYRLPFVAVVGNDARWNAEYQIQLRQHGANRAQGCTLLPTRYDRVCEAFGGHGELVASAADLLPSLARAQASGLPACLNVLIEGVPAPSIRRDRT